MINDLKVFTTLINGRYFNLLSSPEASTEDAKKALTEFLVMVCKIEQDSRDRMDKQPQEEKKDDIQRI